MISSTWRWLKNVLLKTAFGTIGSHESQQPALPLSSVAQPSPASPNPSCPWLPCSLPLPWPALLQAVLQIIRGTNIQNKPEDS